MARPPRRGGPTFTVTAYDRQGKVAYTDRFYSPDRARTEAHRLRNEGNIVHVKPALRQP